MTKNADAHLKELDDFDRRLLALVQKDNQSTHAELGETVGLSPSAVRRRLKRFRDSGLIMRDVALLNPDSIGVRLVITVSFQNETVETLEAFDRQMQDLPEVSQCYHVSGATDYVLIVHGPSVDWYEEWGKRVFMGNPDIRRYDSHVVWSCKKFETAMNI
ncbi:MAG: Lrp/AsnC family transcriptional regulator [Pseudomonadota bacterium]